MPKVRHRPLLPGAIALGACWPALAAPPVRGAYPGLLQMLLPALLFVVLVLCAIRLAGWVGRRAWLARRAGSLALANALLWVMAMATVLVLGFVLPLLSAPQQRAIPGGAFNAMLVAGAIALLTTPLAWRACLVRFARAGAGEVRVMATRSRVAWLCVVCAICAFAISLARLHQPSPPAIFGVLQFACLAIFLLTLAPALRGWIDRLRPRAGSAPHS